MLCSVSGVLYVRHGSLNNKIHGSACVCVCVWSHIILLVHTLARPDGAGARPADGTGGRRPERSVADKSASRKLHSLRSCAHTLIYYLSKHTAYRTEAAVVAAAAAGGGIVGGRRSSSSSGRSNGSRRRRRRLSRCHRCHHRCRCRARVFDFVFTLSPVQINAST